MYGIGTANFDLRLGLIVMYKGFFEGDRDI